MIGKIWSPHFGVSLMVVGWIITAFHPKIANPLDYPFLAALVVTLGFVLVLIGVMMIVRFLISFPKKK